MAANTEDDDDGVFFKLNAGSCYLPKHNIERPKGEDAHLILPDKNIIGVADGVGSWSKKGVDAGEYSRCLMHSAHAAAKTMTGLVDPLELLQMARIVTKLYRSTRNPEFRGSSTACIIALNGTFLDYVNIGDSGLMVFRDSQMIHQSPIQQHGFNHPYQVGCGCTHDDPRSAFHALVPLKAGDIVVAATDGLFDNMFPSELSQVLEKECDKDPREIASIIAKSALSNALNENYDSPFAQAALKAGIQRGLGGKYDDITVIVAKVELRTRILQASKLSLKVRSNGNVNVQALPKLNSSSTIDDIKEAVTKDDKQHFSPLEEKENGEPLIRENHGHKIKVTESERSLKPILSAEEFPVCVRGTYQKNIKSILKSGLKCKQRSHVHFSCGLPTDGEVISGIRQDVNVLIYLDIKKALEEGMELYITDNRVILTKGFDGVVPVKFFEKIESWSDRQPIVFET